MRKPSGCIPGIRDRRSRLHREATARKSRSDRPATSWRSGCATGPPSWPRPTGHPGRDPGAEAGPGVLLKQSSVLRSILDSIGDAIIVAEDLDGPLSFNPAARELFGIGADPVSLAEWLGTDRFGVVDSDDPRPPSRIDRPLRRALRGEEFDDLELIVRRSGPDRVRWIQAKARPRRDPDGRYAGP